MWLFFADAGRLELERLPPGLGWLAYLVNLLPGGVLTFLFLVWGVKLYLDTRVTPPTVGVHSIALRVGRWLAGLAQLGIIGLVILVYRFLTTTAPDYLVNKAWFAIRLRYHDRVHYEVFCEFYNKCYDQVVQESGRLWPEFDSYRPEVSTAEKYVPHPDKLLETAEKAELLFREHLAEILKTREIPEVLVSNPPGGGGWTAWGVLAAVGAFVVAAVGVAAVFWVLGGIADDDDGGSPPGTPGSGTPPSSPGAPGSQTWTPTVDWSKWSGKEFLREWRARTEAVLDEEEFDSGSEAENELTPFLKAIIEGRDGPSTPATEEEEEEEYDGSWSDFKKTVPPHLKGYLDALDTKPRLVKPMEPAAPGDQFASWVDHPGVPPSEARHYGEVIDKREVLPLKAEPTPKTGYMELRPRLLDKTDPTPAPPPAESAPMVLTQEEKKMYPFLDAFLERRDEVPGFPRPREPEPVTPPSSSGDESEPAVPSDDDGDNQTSTLEEYYAWKARVLGLGPDEEYQTPPGDQSTTDEEPAWQGRVPTSSDEEPTPSESKSPVNFSEIEELVTKIFERSAAGNQNPPPPAPPSEGQPNPSSLSDIEDTVENTMLDRLIEGAPLDSEEESTPQQPASPPPPAPGQAENEFIDELDEFLHKNFPSYGEAVKRNQELFSTEAVEKLEKEREEHPRTSTTPSDPAEPLSENLLASYQFYKRLFGRSPTRLGGKPFPPRE